MFTKNCLINIKKNKADVRPVDHVVKVFKLIRVVPQFMFFLIQSCVSGLSKSVIKRAFLCITHGNMVCVISYNIFTLIFYQSMLLLLRQQ